MADHEAEGCGGDGDSSDWSDSESLDSCEEYINFKSIRDPSTKLEEAIEFSWPGIYDDGNGAAGESPPEGGNGRGLRRLRISTLLDEDDIAPLFDGSRWAGTRLWGAAIRAAQFLDGRLPDADPGEAGAGVYGIGPACGGGRGESGEGRTPVRLLELGAGLAVPGMIYHLLGGDVVVTDQADILSQLEANVTGNFPSSEEGADGPAEHSAARIRARALNWSRDGVVGLLSELDMPAGFDVVLNCDCVYEPLYGKSWVLLNDVIDELLRANPRAVVVSSMERRTADGIDDFLAQMRGMEHVGKVEMAWRDENRSIEIYVTTGKAT